MSRKDATPRETIERIENILHENGLTYTITSETNNCNMFFSIRVEILANGYITGANGKGMTHELALASGLAELMERLQSRNGMKFWYSTKNYPEKAFVHEYESEAILDDSIKNDFVEFSNSLLARYRIDYINAKDNSIISIPNRLINLICGSNGLCAGNSKAEAIVQGVSEVFERYIQKIVSKNHIRCPYIQKEDLYQYSFLEKMHCFEEKGLDWELLDCTNDNRFPVVGLLLVDKKNMRYSIVLGADVDFEIAVERCITELLQGRNLDNLSMTYMKPIDFEKIGNTSVTWDVTEQSDYYDFVDNYISNNGQHPFYLLSETCRIKVPSIFRHLTNNNEAFQYILNILDMNHIPLYYADFSYLGFPTYRVFIPQLSQVFEMKQESFTFLDKLQQNLSLLMRMDSLTEHEKHQLVTSLVDYSMTYNNRRNAFQSVLFRYCGKKDFDFNYLYLDFVIALLYLSLSDYKNAEKYYTRFFLERRLYKSPTTNELLKVIYVYIIGLSQGLQLDEIKIMYSRIFNRKTSQYVYEFIKNNNCLKIVYWPSCPNCEKCAYEKECAYQEWEQINSTLRKKQTVFYARVEGGGSF